MRVTLKQSKTDPFRKAIDLFGGRTGTDLCPVKSLLNYLLAGQRFKAGSSYSWPFSHIWQRLVDEMRGALSTAGFDLSKYNGLNFWIGAATTAAEKGMEDSVIKTLGRWRSLYSLHGVHSHPWLTTPAHDRLVTSFEAV